MNKDSTYLREKLNGDLSVLSGSKPSGAATTALLMLAIFCSCAQTVLMSDRDRCYWDAEKAGDDSLWCEAEFGFILATGITPCEPKSKPTDECAHSNEALADSVMLIWAACSLKVHKRRELCEQKPRYVPAPSLDGFL